MYGYQFFGSKVFSVAMVLALSLSSLSVAAQDQDVRIGDKIPLYLLNEVYYWKKSDKKEQIELSELRGRWILLDFWTRGCAACVPSFPKLDKIGKKFSENTDVILVGVNDRYSMGIKAYYDGIRLAQSIDLPVAYDSMLWRKFGFYTVPHLVVIDPKGIVRKVVDTGKFDESELVNLMKEH